MTETEGYQIRTKLLNSIEQFIITNTQAQKNGGISERNEMKLWLVDTIASLPRVGDIHRNFEELAINKIESFEKDFTHQVLLLACQNTPRDVAKVLANEGRIFQRFFRNDDDRAMKWFQHFKFSGENEFGAVALERYLFDMRDEMWERLKWKGKHDVTPVVAVQKRNLLMELDVAHAVDMLVREDDFWTSTYFQECLVSGDFLALDYEYFVEVLEAKLEGTETSTIRNLMKNYLKRETNKELSQQLLRFLTDKELLTLIYHSLPADKQLNLVEYMLSECRWKNMDELLLYNALAAHTPILVSRIIKDEEGKNLPDQMDQLLVDDPTDSQQAYHTWLSQKGNAKSKKRSEYSHMWARFIALEGFLVFYRLRQHVTSREKFEETFQSFGVLYEALFDEIPVDDEPNLTEKKDKKDKKDRSKREKKEKKEKHKHKKRRHSRSSSPTKIFIGWRLSNPDLKGEDAKITYGMSEAPQYLYNVFVQRLLNSIE